MSINKIFIFFLFNFFLIESSFANIKSKIIAKVGSEIITSFEIKNKILGNLILTNNTINQENINKIKRKTLNDLVDIKIKKNELNNKKIQVDARQVNAYLNQISTNNIENLKREFKDNNLNFDLFVEEVEIELKWQKLIYNKYSSKIETESDYIYSEINKILDTELTSKEVNLSEIQIISSSDQSKDEIISNTLKEIKKNGFENTALNLSISSSSSNKGNLGWINTKALSKEMYNIVMKLKPGGISEPISQSDSILFIKLNEERQISNKDIDKENFKKNLVQQKQNEIFNQYSINHLSTIKNKYLVEYK